MNSLRARVLPVTQVWLDLDASPVHAARVRGEIQLWIIGAGPAALALADACCRRGVRVGMVAPEPHAAWMPNYAMWRDDAEQLGVGEHVQVSWSRARADFAGGARNLDRGYALLDDAALQRSWHTSCAEAGMRVAHERVEEILHDDEGVELVCASGARLRGCLVVDASGHQSRFVEREPGPPPAYQVAWGEQWRVPELDAEVQDTVTFMDWTAADEREDEDQLPPTFLYTMPLDRDRVFVEETVLAARLERPPAALFEPLAARLQRRLERQGFERLGDAPLELERCIIPMGTPLPRGDQRTLAFGGAASMVHPATGYTITNVLRRRERVADAIATELESWVGPGVPSQRIWKAIWTTQEVQAWRLYGFGLEILCDFDRAGTDRFFSEFFELPDQHWRSFVSADVPSPKLMATMLRYYASVSRPIRSRLSAALLSSEGWRMFRGFTGLARG